MVQDTPGDGVDPQRFCAINWDKTKPFVPHDRAGVGTGTMMGVGAGKGQAPCSNHPIHRSYLDMAKVVVFRYLFWVVLVVVFIAGANRISLFGLGYVLACFYLLLSGTAMLRKPARARLALWDCLILYNITVIVSKNMLSVSCGLQAHLVLRSPWVSPGVVTKPCVPFSARSSCPASSCGRCRTISAG